MRILYIQLLHCCQSQFSTLERLIIAFTANVSLYQVTKFTLSLSFTDENR